MKKIIVFYGDKGSGKDTCFEILEKICFFNNGKNIHKVFFADYLKDVVYSLFKTKIGDKKRIWGNIEDKESPIDGWKIPEDIKTACGFTEEYWTGRRLLQWFGTDVCRKIYDNVWVDSLAKTIASKAPVCDIFGVTDCRFKNEYDMMVSLKTEYNVIFVHVKRWEKDNQFSGHASEQDMQNFECDIEINNTGSLDDLEKLIEEIYRCFLV